MHQCHGDYHVVTGVLGFYRKSICKHVFCRHLGEELYYTRYKGTARTVKTKVVCGAGEADQMFLDFHASPMGAHCGQTKTRESISRRFYWPGMSVDINKWVSQQYKLTI